MSLHSIVCEHCSVKLKSTKGFTAGTKVKCPKCAKSFVVQEEEEEVLVKAKLLEDDEDEDEDQDQDEEEAPAKAKKSAITTSKKIKPQEEDDEEEEAPVAKKKKRSRDEDEDDEDEEDEAPVTKKKKRARDEDDEDNEDEEADDKPKKKGKKKAAKKGGGSTKLILLGVAVFFVLGGGVLLGLWAIGAIGSNAEAEYDAIAKEAVELMNELVAIFASVKDKASADAAKPRLQTAHQKFVKLSDREKVIASKLSAEKRSAIEKKYEQPKNEVVERIKKEGMRLAFVPGGLELLQEMSKFQTIR